MKHSVGLLNRGKKMKYQKGYKCRLYETEVFYTCIRPSKDIVTKFCSLTTEGVLTGYEGYAWDLASAPVFQTKSSKRGTLAHDIFYQLMRMGELDIAFRPLVDSELKRICIEDGMWEWRAEMWRKMVSKFAAGAADKSGERPILEAP